MLRARAYSVDNNNRQFGLGVNNNNNNKDGLKGLIQQNFHPGLSSELERLFLPDLMSVTCTLPLAMPPSDGRHSTSDGSEAGSSAASSPGLQSVSPWDEFRTNGRDQDLDELDLLVRGMDGAAPPEPEPEPDTFELPLAGLFSYPPLSVSPGSDSVSSQSSGEILTKARLLEILRERERERMLRRRQKVKGDKVCVFCRNNGESEAVYTTHQLKDAQGRVTCPVLYIYTCPICGASGENSHTIKYCPLNPHDKKAKNPCRSPRNSAGKRR